MLGKLGDPGRYQVKAFFYSDNNHDKVGNDGGDGGDGGDEEDLGHLASTRTQYFILQRRISMNFSNHLHTFRFPSIFQFLGGVLFIICVLSIV